MEGNLHEKNHTLERGAFIPIVRNLLRRTANVTSMVDIKAVKSRVVPSVSCEKENVMLMAGRSRNVQKLTVRHMLACLTNVVGTGDHINVARMDVIRMCQKNLTDVVYTVEVEGVRRMVVKPLRGAGVTNVPSMGVEYVVRLTGAVMVYQNVVRNV